MSWPWRRRAPQPTEEAREALRQANRSLVDAERLDQAACEAAEKLQATRARNHFAEAVARSMRKANDART